MTPLPPWCNQQMRSAKEARNLGFQSSSSPSMAASTVKVPMFADTNLGTRVAIDVSPDIAVGDVKRELQRAHLNCFPNIGEIAVNRLMVKRKSCFYHLPNSLPIKYAYQGWKGSWFIHMDTCPQSAFGKSGLSECLAADIGDPSDSVNVTDSIEPNNCMSNENNTNCRRNKRGTKRIPCLKAVLPVILRPVCLSKRIRRKKVKKNNFLHPRVKGFENCPLDRKEYDSIKEEEIFASRTDTESRGHRKSDATMESSSETLSEVISVSGIIQKYFSAYDEVTLSPDIMGTRNQIQHEEQLTTGEVSPMLPFTPKTPPRMLPFPLPDDLSSTTSRGKFKRTEVGKRLLLASNKLGMPCSTCKSASDLSRIRNQKSSVPKSCSVTRSRVFEISDSDDE